MANFNHDGSHAGRADNEDDSSDMEGDGDATSAKQRANRAEAVSYGPNDDDDDANVVIKSRLNCPAIGCQANGIARSRVRRLGEPNMR